jgi:hypothetical protein
VESVTWTASGHSTRVSSTGVTVRYAVLAPAANVIDPVRLV